MAFFLSFACLAQTAAPSNSPANSASRPQIEIVRSVKPQYPGESYAQGIRGPVVVRVIVSGAGDVEKAEVISGDPALSQAATDAAMQWKFKPLTQNGQPVKAATRISVDFAVPGTADESAKITTAADGTKRAVVPTGVSQGWLIRGGIPDYPPIALSHQIDGVVVLQVTIDTQGKIKDLKLISGPEMFVRAAMDAVWQWRYTPYMLGGKPIEVETQVVVNFNHSKPQ